MSHINNILTKCKAAIAASTTFDTEANIFKREELVDDELDRSKINIFVYPVDAVQNEVPIVVDFRKYRVRVVCRFEVDGRANAPTATDTVTENKSDYNDALKTALEGTLPTGTYAIANVFHVDYLSTDFNFEEQDALEGRDFRRVYRIAQLWEFNTYES